MKEMIYSPDRLTLGEVLDNGVYGGYEYAIINYGTHPCAYIRIPESHKYFGIHYSQIPIKCHGGLTYSDSELLELFREDEWWIGWDYAHAYDYTGFDVLFPSEIEYKKWSTDEILAEVKDVIHEMTDILIEIAPISSRVKHLARYAKKKRVRKKNMNRIHRTLKKIAR